MISEALKRIKPSATILMSQKARELKEKGHEVISLSAGEPDFAPPEHILKAAIEAIKKGANKYTAVDGIVPLKQAILEKFSRDNHIHYDLSEVMVSTGGKQVLYNAFVATLNPEDEVIIPAPYWVSYPQMVNLVGGRSVFINTTAESGFKITPKELEKAITQKTKWLILNSPSNPTGAVYSKEELQAISKVLLKYTHVHIMTDDIYEHIVFDDSPFATIAGIEPSLKDRVLTVNGVSKAYAMTGWRVGYCGGNSELIKAMTKVQSQSTSNVTAVSQYATIAALQGDQEFLIDNVALFRKRRDLVVSMLNNIPGLHCGVPSGAFYIYADCQGVIGKKTPKGSVITSDEDFVMGLLESEAVGLVFGAAFGLSPYFRLSYAESEENLMLACQKIQTFCNSLS